MTDTKIILASGSPRRAEILRNIGLDFEVRPTGADETIDPELSPTQMVCELAFRKAEEAVLHLSASEEDALIIAADTVVVYNGQILGKPADEQDAYRMLKCLSGTVHAVYTGFTLAKNGFYFTEHASTEVEFLPIKDDLIYRYIQTGEPFDKAGAYGIQGKGSALIRAIHGDYFNVMGLPVSALVLAARAQFDIDLLGF